jgi:hypothetical protein
VSRDQREGHHESLVRRETVEGASDRSFGVVFAGVFSVIGLLPLIHGGTPRAWSFAVAAAFLLVALVRPGILATPNRMWLRLAMALHRVVSPIVLAGLFYLLVTPVGVVARLARGDVLGLRFQPQADSYWADREPADPSDLYRQY